MRSLILKFYVWYYLRKTVLIDKISKKVKEIR